MIAASVRRGVVLLLAVAAIMAASAAPVPIDGVPYEPIYHIRPPKNWINDPNGPYRDPVTGKIHLYMQYNPSGPLWGDIAWYHVTSEDYVTWTRPESPVAMYADKWYDKWGAYTGTLMNNNYSEPVVFYTCAEPQDQERQCIANFPKADINGKRTLDTFVKSALNVVLSEDDVPNIVALNNFRDPSEWWQDPVHPERWLVAFAARLNDSDGDNAHIIVFGTEDPSFQSGYTYSHSMYSYKYDLYHMFECSDVFTLRAGGEHFLKVSTMQARRDYFIYGSYQLSATIDQYVFVEDTSRSPAFIDFGPYYAAKTFHDPILNRRTIWGWTTDELTNAQITANGWSGVQNLLRTMEYDKAEGKLKTQPVPEIKGLRLDKLVDLEGISVTSTPKQIVTSNTNNTLYHEIIARFTLADPTSFSASATYATDADVPEVGVMIRANANLSQYTTVSVRMPVGGPDATVNMRQVETYGPIKIFTGPDAANCSAECNSTRICESYTFWKSNSTCKMYWKSNTLGAATDATSGTVREPLLYFGRTQSGSIGTTLPLHGRAPFTTTTPNSIELHIFVDDSVVEAFKDEGLETLTGRLYINNGASTTGIAVYARNVGAVTVNIQVFTMDSIWKTPTPNAAKNFTNSLYNLLDTLIDA